MFSIFFCCRCTFILVKILKRSKVTQIHFSFNLQLEFIADIVSNRCCNICIWGIYCEWTCLTVWTDKRQHMSSCSDTEHLNKWWLFYKESNLRTHDVGKWFYPELYSDIKHFQYMLQSYMCHSTVKTSITCLWHCKKRYRQILRHKFNYRMLLK